MDYPVPPYGFVAPAGKSSGFKIGVAVAICIVVLLIIAAVAIALGVGLGVGLTRNKTSSSGSSGSSSNSGTAATSATTAYSILSAPTVNCVYSGSSSCGCAATQPSFVSPRIIQGYAAVANSWPWAVALYINNNQIFCGGFLVTYQHVVTAAHCVNGIAANTITVFAGIQKLSLRTSGQSRGVSNVTVNPGYTSSAYVNDVAVLQLQSPLTQTSAVGLCCLTSDTSLPALGDHAVIIGWGYTVQGGPNLSDDLLQGVIEVQGDSSSCTTASASTPNSLVFCAGYSGTDSCQGDSGGAFMTNVNNAWTCTGMVSFGVGCGTNAYYVRLAAYQSFISGVING
jgi:secreted trypsin-like serine protease